MLYNICGIIKEVVGSGIYLMVVAKDYKLYNLNKYDCCEVKNILIKKVDYEIWNDVLLIMYNHSNYSQYLKIINYYDENYVII